MNLPLLEKMKPGEARLLFVTIGLLTLWFYSSILIKPLLKGTMQKKQMIEAKMVQLHKNRKAIDQKSALQKAFESLGSFDTVTEEEAPERRNELIQAIDRVKSKVGIQLENFHPGNPVIGNHFVQFKVSVEVDDRLDKIANFILELKNAPQQLNIRNIRITTSTQKEKSLRASFTVAQMMVLKRK